MEYVCNSILTNGFGTFTCKDDEQWMKSNPECTAYPCDGDDKTVLTQDDDYPRRTVLYPGRYKVCLCVVRKTVS